MDTAELVNRFEFHPASTPERRQHHEAVRSACCSLALSFDALLPDGREKALAITHLEEVMFWANAALARRPEPTAVEPPDGGFTCPRRIEGPQHSVQGQDTFQERAGLGRCSYCGSIAPAELLDLIEAGAEIGPTDKGYKLYVRPHGHPADDVVKFYAQHLTPGTMAAFAELWIADRITWGYPGGPYVPLALPGISDDSMADLKARLDDALRGRQLSWDNETQAPAPSTAA